MCATPPPADRSSADAVYGRLLRRVLPTIRPPPRMRRATPAPNWVSAPVEGVVVVTPRTPPAPLAEFDEVLMPRLPLAEAGEVVVALEPLTLPVPVVVVVVVGDVVVVVAVDDDELVVVPEHWKLSDLVVVPTKVPVPVVDSTCTRRALYRSVPELGTQGEPTVIEYG